MRARDVLVTLILIGAFQPAQGAPASPELNDVFAGCAPQRAGDGARWLIPCQRAAENGDGQAALILGMIHWNGDGVPKDNAASARWWKVADQAGRPEAAKLLGD